MTPTVLGCMTIPWLLTMDLCMCIYIHVHTGYFRVHSVYSVGLQVVAVPFVWTMEMCVCTEISWVERSQRGMDSAG